MIVKGYRFGKPFDLLVEPVLQQGKKFYLKPETKSAFEHMRAAALGDNIGLHINTAFRDMEWQTRLYETYQRRLKEWLILPISDRGPRPVSAARPGWSNHQQGTTIDLQTDGGRGPWLLAHASKFDFYTTVHGEPWHHEHMPHISGIVPASRA